MDPVTLVLLLTGALGSATAISKKIFDNYQQKKQVADMATIFKTSPQLNEIILPLSVSTPLTP